MTKPILPASVAVLFGLGTLLAPAAVPAASMSGHSAGVNTNAPAFRHHRTHRHFPYLPYYYYGYGYDYGTDYAPPPPPPPAKTSVIEKPAETRRGCESQTYKVPSDEGEKEVTILRC
jgi:hypothetical protein